MDHYSGVVGSLANMLPYNYDINNIIEFLLINNIKIVKGSKAEEKINKYLNYLNKN